MMGSELSGCSHPWQASAVTTDEQERSSAMAGRRIADHSRATAAPVPLALTLRRHIDLARVSSAACR